MPDRLKRNEKFHIIVFFAVFVYFAVLKVTGHIEIAWNIMLFPLAVGVILFYAIKYCKKIAHNRRSK